MFQHVASCLTINRTPPDAHIKLCGVRGNTRVELAAQDNEIEKTNCQQQNKKEDECYYAMRET